MMMMTSVNPAITNSLRESLKKYATFRTVDAVLLNAPNLTKQQELNDEKPSWAKSYDYTNTKLVAATAQRGEQYDILKQVLEDLADNGVIDKPLTEAVVINAGKKSGTRDDDGAPEINTSRAEIAKKFGVGDLITDKTLSNQAKKDLATAYLTEFNKITTDIKDLSKEELKLNASLTTPEQSFEKLTQDYAKTKKVYINAVKKALAEDIITLQGDELEKASSKAKLEAFKADDKIALIKAETTTGNKNLGVDANKNAVVTNLKTLKTKLETLQQQANSSFKVSDLDSLLQSDDAFEVDQKQLDRITSSNEFRTTAEKANGKSNESVNPFLTTAKGLKKTLATLKQEKGDENSGITMEKFDNLLAEQGTVFEDFYKKQKTDVSLPTFDEIFNEKTGDAVDDKGNKIGRFQYKNEIAGAEETNRTRSLAKENIGRPIGITTQRDQSPIDVGTTKVKGIDVQITFEPEETQVNKNSANSKKLLLSTFRGQPAVISQKGGKFYVRFYDTQKEGNGHVLTTGIAEVDPKLVFKNKEHTQPKTELDVSMLKKDSQGRKVIDYYVRSFDKGGFTDDNKVYYVARNFADNIDRLPSVRAAQYFAAMDADPINFKTKEQKQQGQLQKQATTIPNLGLSNTPPISTEQTTL